MNTMIIAVAGGTGSGKSFLARNLANTYSKKEILIIEQDSYYKDISNLDYKDRCKQNFDHPDAIDSILIENHLKKLLSGKTIYSPRYNFFKHLRERKEKKIKQRPIIIIEGILLLHYVKLHKFYTLKVFVETPEHIRINRRIERDIKFRGRTKSSIEKQYYSTVKPMHEEFVQPSKSYSDIVIDGTALINKSINQIKSKLDLEV
ncbi:MAG: uridine kinase [Candidatus Neomarinimicrobiota bacterium]